MSSTLLLIDDDAFVGATLSDWLAPLDVEVHQARTVRDAIAFLGTRRPEVVILDGLLPDSTGPAFLQTYRALLDGIPVLFSSAFWRDIGSHRQILEAGATEVIPKPLTPERIQAAVGAALDRSVAEKMRVAG